MIYLYNSTNGSEPPAQNLKDYAGIYLQLDPTFSQFAALREKYKAIYWGAWYKWTENTLSSEVDRLYNLLGGNPGTLPPAIQFIGTSANWAVTILHLGEFIQGFAKKFGKNPVFQTNLTTWSAMYKFGIPTTIKNCPLWIYGTTDIPHALISHDDITIEFAGTKAELLTWAQTYKLPVLVSESPIITSDELLKSFAVFIKDLKAYLKS
jgi:hypothetical protein